MPRAANATPTPAAANAGASLTPSPTMIVDAVFKRDYAVLQTSILFAAGAFILTTLMVDLLYGVLDPRLKAATRESAA